MSSSTSPGLTEALPATTWLEGPHGRLAFHAYPAARPWLHVLISHGFAEHTGWWHHVAVALQARGVSAYVFDHYHHGHSAGAPADVADYAHLVAGLRTVLEQGVTPRLDGAPLVVLAHSNGALVTLLALNSLPPDAVQGLVLCSPFLGLRRPVAWGGGLLAAVLRLISPRLRVPLATRPWRLTGCRAIWPQYHADPLRFRSISVRFFLAMRRAVRAVQGVTELGGRPLLLLRAGQEQVVSPEAVDAWYARVQTPDKSRRDYPDLHHELFNEAEWEAVLDDVLAWCSQRWEAPADALAQARAAVAGGAGED
ncbi:MAG TPA: alpha/beta fold hydrolase [bacterium]|nr:alpha/beta fold hydrolase [bacterium]